MNQLSKLMHPTYTMKEVAAQKMICEGETRLIHILHENVPGGISILLNIFNLIHENDNLYCYMRFRMTLLTFKLLYLSSGGPCRLWGIKYITSSYMTTSILVYDLFST